MSAARVISLIGLPGAGKTTLGKALAVSLGAEWSYLGIGDVLRQIALADLHLRAQLDGGHLGPEDLVAAVVSTALSSHASSGGLIIDGFPRHTAQVSFAREKFSPWVVVYLDVVRDVAMERLQRRNGNTLLRAEDTGSALALRFAQAETDIAALLQAIESETVLRLDAQKTPADIHRQALQELVKTDVFR